ncbi:MAG: butyrate kinase, partial [Planctomycetes bacterium]|nr:butyrate kinase [Planctomycetota bacterium]
MINDKQTQNTSDDQSKTKAPDLSNAALLEEYSKNLNAFLDDSLRLSNDPLIKLFVEPNKAQLEKLRDKFFICINPGSTSTKVAVYQGFKLFSEEEVHIPPHEDDSFETRMQTIENFINELEIDHELIAGISGRGGFLANVIPNTFQLVPEMLKDLEHAEIAHASNLGIPLVFELNKKLTDSKAVATTSFPVCSDEMNLFNKMTGYSRIQKQGRGAHYLNHKAVYHAAKKVVGVDDSEPIITAHLGGGVSFARHENNKMINVFNAFSVMPGANRSGSLPLYETLRMIQKGELTIPEIEKALTQRGGLFDLAGTNSFRTLEHFYEHSANNIQKQKIELIFDFYAKSFAHGILKMAFEKKKAYCAVLTGGIARSENIISRIKQYLHNAIPLLILPGAFEHQMMISENMKTYLDNGYSADYVKQRNLYKEHHKNDSKVLNTRIMESHFRRRPGLPITDLTILSDLVQQDVAHSNMPIIGLVGADNEEAMLAAKMANESGKIAIAKFALIGDSREINSIAWEFDIKIDNNNYTIYDSQDPVAKGVELLIEGKVDILMKGKVKTDEIMRGYILGKKAAGTLPKGCLISHVGVFEIPSYPKLLIVSDAAVNTYPNFEQRLKIMENAIEVAKSLNVHKPKVAIISAIERPNKNIISSIDAAELADRFKDRNDCIAEGPLSFDVALGPHIAAEKNYPGKIQGDADILIVPDIDAGNVIYKTLTVTAGATIAGIILGGGDPFILTSRGDNARSKFASICLT